jgi:hypothetical protein
MTEDDMDNNQIIRELGNKNQALKAGIQRIHEYGCPYKDTIEGKLICHYCGKIKGLDHTPSCRWLWIVKEATL